MVLAAPLSHFALLLAAAIPVAIYLIFRRRRKDTPWGAIYILRRLLETKSRMSAWKQYLIVALRTIAFAALAFAFLQPHRNWSPPAEGGFPPAPGSTHRVLLLDVSGSMDAAYGSGSCLDAGLSLCRKALAAGRFPGRIDVLPMDGTPTPHRFEDLPPGARDIETFIGRMERGPGPVDPEAAIRAALQAFRASHYRRKELFILTDLGAAGFAGLERHEGLLAALKKLDVAVYTLSYENPSAVNFALLDLTPGMDVLLAGQPTVFYVRVGYYGAAPTADAWLTIRDDNDEPLFEDTVSLARGEKTIEIPLTLPSGRRHLAATLGDDDFAPDNALSRNYEVRDVLRLAIVQNINLDDGFSNPRAWLKLVLGEGAGSAPVSDHLRSMIEHGVALQAAIGKTAVPESEAGATEQKREPRYATVADFINPAQLGPDTLAGYDGAIVLDLDSAQEEAVQALREYAVRGGTVFLAPGPAAEPSRFNAAFAALSPAQLEAPLLEQIDPERHESAVLEKAGDLLLRELEAPQHGNIGNARFYNCFRTVAPEAESDVEVLFSLSNGAPLLLYRPHGRGACMLWTAGLGMDWHSMVVHPAYPVFLSRLFNLAAARRRYALNLEPGEPIIAEVDGPRAVLVLPSGEQVLREATPMGEGHIVRFDRTDEAGTYLLKQNDDLLARYTVCADNTESDYRPLQDGTRARYEELTGTPIATDEPGLFQVLGRHYRGRSMEAVALWTLLGLLVLEAGLARRWFS